MDKAALMAEPNAAAVAPKDSWDEIEKHTLRTHKTSKRGKGDLQVVATSRRTPASICRYDSDLGSTPLERVTNSR